MATSRSTQSLEQNPQFYQNLLQQGAPDDIVETVKIDIPRTFPDNIYFDVHKPSLYNVLIAFSAQNDTVGCE